MNIDTAFPSKYLKATDLPAEGKVVTIKVVTAEQVSQDPGSEPRPVAHFTDSKPLPLNRTNAATIASILGSPETEAWTGRTVELYPTTTFFQGRQTPCTRVRQAPPSSQTPVSEKAPDSDGGAPF